MKFLNRFLGADEDYIRLVSGIKKKEFPIALSGLTGIHKAVIASALTQNEGRRLVMITDTEAAALGLKDDLTALGISAGHLPARILHRLTAARKSTK